MKQVNFRLTDNQYKEIMALCENKGYKNVPSLFKDLALTIIANKQVISVSGDNDYLDERIHIKVTENVRNKLTASAIANGWTLSKEVRYRINQTMSSDPVLLDKEIEELRWTRNEIMRVGRNVYSLIAKRQQLEVNDARMWEDIKTMNRLIESARKTINTIASYRANIIPVKRG